MFQISSDLALLFGLASAITGFLSFLPYVIDILAGRTMPQRSSWLIWAVVTMLALASQMAEGATRSLLFSGAQAVMTLVVFALSIRRGAGSYMHPGDAIAIGVCAIAIALWQITDVPAYALACAIGVNSIAGTLTVVKSFRAPETETLATWVLGIVASAFGILSVGVLDPVLLAYPVYLFCLYVSVATAVLLGRARMARVV